MHLKSLFYSVSVLGQLASTVRVKRESLKAQLDYFNSILTADLFGWHTFRIFSVTSDIRGVGMNKLIEITCGRSDGYVSNAMERIKRHKQNSHGRETAVIFRDIFLSDLIRADEHTTRYVTSHRGFWDFARWIEWWCTFQLMFSNW